MTFIDATDININSGSGGLGLGAPSFTGSPASGTDIAPGAGIGSTGLPAIPGVGVSGVGGGGGDSVALNGAQAGAIGTQLGAVAGGFMATWAGRIIVVVLGLVFVAAGLRMLGTPVLPRDVR